MQTAGCVLGTPGRSFTVLREGRRIRTRFSSPCTAQALLWVSAGAELALVQNSRNCCRWLPAVFGPPKPIGEGPGHPMHDAASALRCSLFDFYEQDFAFVLAPNVPLSAQPVPMVPGSTAPGAQRWPHKLAPRGCLHISASLNSVWGQCSVHSEMTFHWDCKMNASRSEITWTSVRKAAGRAGRAQSLMCVTVAEVWHLVRRGEPLFPPTSVFFFFALCKIFFVLFWFKLHFVLQFEKP